MAVSPENSFPRVERLGLPVDSTRRKGRALANALSVDVEDYFHVEAFADRIRPETWSQFPSRVVQNTHRVLEMFAEAGARATFFVLGWVAEREPALVREILAAGHEVACHSHMHRRVFTMTPREFRADLCRALHAIEDAGGERVRGYRAPTFSIRHESLWALEILTEEGFLYDSSVFPVKHDLYGMPRAPRFPYTWRFQNGSSLHEIPPQTVRVCGRNLPVAGGGYLRIFPMSYTRWALRRLREREGRSAVIYFHPWELDPEQPRLSGKMKSRFRHYLNLSRMERRVRDLLRSGEFVSLKTFLDTHLEAKPVPATLVTAAN